MPTILKKRLFNQRGITLIELIAVILIIGIIAAVGIPVVFNQINGAKAETDKANQAVFASAIERYATVKGEYPKLTTGNLTLEKFIQNTLNVADGGPYLRGDFPTTKAVGGDWTMHQGEASSSDEADTVGDVVKSIH